jgi:branched-chain amino acid transport system substrate-binding protein
MVLGIVAGIMDLKEKFGFDTVYFIIQDVAAYRGVAKMTSQIIEKKGVKLLGYDRFPTGASQFASALTRVKETGAKIIMIDMDMPEGAILVKQIKAMKIPAVITGQVVELTGQEAWETYGEKIAGVINMYNQMANLPAKKWPKALSFHEAYQKRWGQGIETGHGPAPAYASIYILRDAIERAGSIDPDAVVKELEETDYVGLLGRTRFDKKSHQLIYGTDIHESAIIANAQWSEQGERVIVFPESVAEGKIALPPSLR